MVVAQQVLQAAQSVRLRITTPVVQIAHARALTHVEASQQVSVLLQMAALYLSQLCVLTIAVP